MEITNYIHNKNVLFSSNRSNYQTFGRELDKYEGIFFFILICLTSLTRAKPKEKMAFPA